ncbi:MAG: RNA polymerase sigma factor [Phycisphaerae bacterium]
MSSEARVFKMYDNYNDAELVRLVCSGQTEAYELLIRRQVKSVYAVVFRVLGNEADAEDITQETFLCALEKIKLHDARFSFRNWLLKMATNLAINHLRSRRRRIDFYRRLAETGHPKVTVEGPLMREDDRRWCEELLDRLPDDQRTAIVLFHLQEMPYTEVAAVMNLPINTVRTLIRRGRLRLRELLTRGSIVENEYGMFKNRTVNG